MQTDRRTRDRVRLFFWAVLTVVCLVAVLVARQQQEQGLQRKIDAAQERAVRFTQNVLADRLDAKRVSQPIGRSGYDELLTELKHGLFNDQRVVRVRVWRDDGLLVFTTDHPGEIGSVKADDVGVDLRPAMRGELTSIVVGESFARDDATTPERTALLSTFVPLRSTDKSSVFGAVQIDNDYALMVDATEQPWKQVQIAFAILALICLVMAIVSLVWSHRPVAADTDGFGPSRREVRAAAKDEKKASAAEADAAKLRERVKELEGKTKAHSEQQAELEKLRNRVAEFESRPAPTQVAAEADPAEMAQLKAHASQLEEQARGAESRVTQLQSRVTEMEAQLRVTTDQLRMAQQRAEEAQAAPPAAEVPPEVQAELQGKLTAAAEVEQVLRDELEASREETQRARHELEQMELAHSEEARSQQGQLDQVRAQARLAEEERQRILAEAAKGPDSRGSHVGRRRVADQGAHTAARTFGGRTGDAARRSSGDRVRSQESAARGRDRVAAGTTRWAGPSRCAAHEHRSRRVRRSGGARRCRRGAGPRRGAPSGRCGSQASLAVTCFSSRGQRGRRRRTRTATGRSTRSQK